MPRTFREPPSRGPRVLDRVRSAAHALAFAAILALAAPVLAATLPSGGASGLHAQSLSFTVKAGVNAARHLDRSDMWAEDISSRTRYGAVVGVESVVQLPWPVDVQVELLYTEKGGRESDGSWARLTYLELPILARVPIPGRNRIPFDAFLNAGIAPAREISCSGQVRPGAGSNGAAPLEPVECSDVRSYVGDFGLVVGGGAELELRGLDVSLELRYTHGTTDLLTRFEHRERMSRTLTLAAGVGLPWSLHWSRR